MKNASRLLVLLLALAIVATACGGGGDGSINEEISKIRETDAKDVEAPERVDPKDFGQPGLILQTNSESWQEMVGAPRGQGAVVLFVQPGGPSDQRGIARGDLITAVDGVKVVNHEHALTLMRSNRGEPRKVTIVGRGDKERELEIKGEIPRQRARPFLDGMIKGNEKDAVLRYLRAQSSGGTLGEALEDLEVALDEEPDFVEALALRGNLVFNRRLATKEKKAQQEFVGQALANWRNALDLNPRHVETLALQAVGRTVLGQAAQGKADADRAIKIDPTSPSANAALARAQIGLKKPAEAAGPARAAIQLNPYTNLTYYRTLASVFTALKRKDDCSKTLLAIVPHLEGSKVPALKKEAEQLEKEAKECE